MIYNKSELYKVKFYTNKVGKSPILEYIDKLNPKEKSKILKYIKFLQANKGRLDKPYSKHIKGKIWELRIGFGKNRYRIFYFIFIKKTIILLHAFLKKTRKTPKPEIKRAEEKYYDVLKNKKIYL